MYICLSVCLSVCMHYFLRIPEYKLQMKGNTELREFLVRTLELKNCDNFNRIKVIRGKFVGQDLLQKISIQKRRDHLIEKHFELSVSFQYPPFL